MRYWMGTRLLWRVGKSLEKVGGRGSTRLAKAAGENTLKFHGIPRTIIQLRLNATTAYHARLRRSKKFITDRQVFIVASGKSIRTVIASSCIYLDPCSSFGD